MARPGRSAPAKTRSAHGHFAKARHRISAHRRIQDLALTGAELPTMAQGRRSTPCRSRSAHRRIADLRLQMSVHRRHPMRLDRVMLVRLFAAADS